MKPLSESEITQLEEVAKKATPGPWIYDRSLVMEANHEAIANNGKWADAKFIAAANPETILRLLNMCKKVTGLVEALEFYAMEEYRPMQFMPWTLARAAISAYKEQE